MQILIVGGSTTGATGTANNSSIQCKSYSSYRSSNINSNVTYCSGEQACIYANVTASSILYSSGGKALYGSGATVSSTPYIYDTGDKTFINAEIDIIRWFVTIRNCFPLS